MRTRVVKKITTLGMLYFVQGLPYGFQDKFIPTYLRSSGLSHTQLSLMKLLLLPWLCKAAFAPFMDLFWTKWFWLLCSLGGLSMISFLGILVQPEYFISVSMWLFLLNLFCALQDIAVDGLAMKILNDNEIGHGNTAQVLGYKLGALSGGGILFWFHFYFGWNGLCLCLFVTYLASILTFLKLYERIHDTKCDTKVCDIVEEEDYAKGIPSEMEQAVRKRRISSNVAIAAMEPREEKKDFLKVFAMLFNTQGTFILMSFLLVYKLGERGALSTFPIFLIDKGVTPKQLSIWSGIFGQSSSMLGSLCSGWLIARNKQIIHLLHYICIARCLPIILQWLVISLWSEDVPSLVHYCLLGTSISSLIILEFSAGMTTTAVFSLMMSCSLQAPDAVQGTHYTVLSSAEVAGKLIFSSVIGAFIDWFGLSYIYFILSLLSVGTVFVIPLLGM